MRFLRMRKKKVGSVLTLLIFLLPWIIGFSVFLVIPMSIALYYSFTNYDVFSPTSWVGIENYLKLPKDSIYIKAVYNTVYFISIAIPLNLFFSLFLALLLNTGVRGYKVFRTIYFIPFIMPLVAIGMVWRWIFNDTYGILNYLLSAVGIDGPAWLASTQWVKPAIILVNLFLIGQQMIIFLAGLQNMPEILYDAAKVDGANWMQKLKHITLPLLSPVILFNAVILAIVSLQVFTLPYTLSWVATSAGQGQGGPAYSSTFYVMYLYTRAFENLQLGRASAMAWVFFIITVCFTYLLFKLTRRWIFYRV